MCKACVDEGLMTVDELDAAVLAGDMSVVPAARRSAIGTTLDQIMTEQSDLTLGLLFLLFGIAEGETENEGDGT